MPRIIGSIVLVALVGALAAARLGVTPAVGAPGVAALAPSPTVSVTTLPALPTIAPGAPTMAPAGPSTSGGSSGFVAPPGALIQVTGDVADPRVFSLKDLQLMRRSSVTLRVMDADGRRRLHIFSGVLLRDIIVSVSPTGPGGATLSTRAYASIIGVNGQTAIIAFPEFEAAFNNKQILLAYMVDGAPLPGQSISELIVPEDQTQARFIPAVATIRIGSPPL